jgi:pullulanase/glycogen debranching enzyme
MPKCIFTDDHFDWEMDAPPKHSASDTVIYEMHVRGFTIDFSSGVQHPGRTQIILLTDNREVPSEN